MQALAMVERNEQADTRRRLRGIVDRSRRVGICIVVVVVVVVVILMPVFVPSANIIVVFVAGRGRHAQSTYRRSESDAHRDLAHL